MIVGSSRTDAATLFLAHQAVAMREACRLLIANDEMLFRYDSYRGSRLAVQAELVGQALIESLTRCWGRSRVVTVITLGGEGAKGVRLS